ncbi:MAG: hypothetical protein ACOC6P_04295 [Candidatus Aminicenantaceae bacterium]
MKDQKNKKAKYSGTYLQALFGGGENRIEIIIKNENKPLKFTMYEERVLDAVINFFSDKDYKSLKPVFISERKFNAMQGYIEKNHLYELAGIKKVKRKDGAEIYPGYEKKKIDDALWSLGGKLFKVVYRYYKTGQIYERQKPLIDVIKEYPDQENYRQGKHAGWWVSLNDVVKVNIESFFRFLPRTKDLYLEVKEYTKNHDSSISTQKGYQFIKWLHKHGTKKKTIRIHWLNLAADLGMKAHIKARLWKQISDILRGLYKMAKFLGYLKSYRHKTYSQNTEDRTVDILELNPEMFEHLKEGKE